MSDVLEAARQQHALGHVPIPVPAGLKKPVLTDWETLRPGADDLPRLFGNGANLGVLLGAASNNLVDADMDWPEAASAAVRLMPPTGWIFGRASARWSHWEYRCDPLPGYHKFSDPLSHREDRGVVGELRCPNPDKGLQTIYPPSVHPGGERYEWHRQGKLAAVDGRELLRATGRTMAAGLLARYWPSGARHDAALALAGTLLRAGWADEEARDFLVAVAEAAGDEEVADRAATVAYTRARLDGNEEATGFTRLKELVDWRVVARATKWLEVDKAATADEESRIATDLHLTDLGNANRLVARHGPDLRWWSTSKRWLVWSGQRWDQNGETDVQERAKETVLSIYEESIAASSQERAEALRKWAKTSESARAIASMITLARSDTALTVDADKLDADPWLFNCRNGTLELQTGTFREHRRADLITKRSPVEYDPAATCPRWLAYLDRIFAGDQELIGFVQRAAGYALTGLTGERVMFILFGSGHNGKTVFVEVMTFICGEYATVSPVETLIAKKDRGIPNDVARLKSARFVCASETEQGDKLAESFIKKITGGDRVAARFLNAEWFDFTPQLKLFLATNHRPQISGTDPAIWDRIRLIPFEVQIPEPERVKGLADWLNANEAAGVLNWALEGCRRWREEGLAAPEKIRRATASYRTEEDVLGIFVEDCCVVQPLVWVSHKDLYTAFKQWVDDHGEEKMGSKTFSQQMSERTGIRKSRTEAARGYSGIRLLAGESARGRQEDGLR